MYGIGAFAYSIVFGLLAHFGSFNMALTVALGFITMLLYQIQAKLEDKDE